MRFPKDKETKLLSNINVGMEAIIIHHMGLVFNQLGKLKGPIVQLEAFRALKLSKSESFRALKFSRLESFRALNIFFILKQSFSKRK